MHFKYAFLQAVMLTTTNPNWICHPLSKLNIPLEAKDIPSILSDLHLGLIASSEHYICTHTGQLHGRTGTKSSKALLVGSQARPPHITMEMALHCGVRINALEGS